MDRFLKILIHVLALLTIASLVRLAYILGNGQGHLECRLECCYCNGPDAGTHYP